MTTPTGGGLLLADLVACSAAVAATRSRKAKTAAIADLLRRAGRDEVGLAAAYLAGQPRQERLSVGWASLRELDVPAAATPSLTLVDVDRALTALAAAAGPGSRAARRAVLTDLMGRATGDEQRFLRGLVLGELRQGALMGVVVQGLAAAAELPEELVRRALMLSADLARVAELARFEGAEALTAIRLTVGVPVQPMLAASAETVEEALTALGRGLVEWKLDGARIQVHRDGDEVGVWTRNLNDVTARSPAVVAAVRDLPADRLVLDGEVLAVGADGLPWAFQQTMSEFSRDQPTEGVPWRPFFFDVLHVDGRDLLDEPQARRHEALAEVVPEPLRIPGRVTDDPAVGAQVLADALAHGHEGVVVKDLDAPYQAGRRGAAWRKVKVPHTLDLVVLAAEWGSGRRRGWLSNLHLGARTDDGFVMLGKTFKGLTDEMLEWQTRRFLELETHRDGHVVVVRPEQVVEIAFDGVQTSTRYPGGVALRFARVKRYRSDKRPEEADTLDTVLAIHAGARPPG